MSELPVLQRYSSLPAVCSTPERVTIVHSIIVLEITG